MKYLSLFKKNAILMLVMQILFTSCSEYYNDTGWQYFSVDGLDDGLYGAISFTLVCLGLYMFVMYAANKTGTGSERNTFYINGEKVVVERPVQYEKMNHADSWRATYSFYKIPFFILLWWFIYGNILFLFKTELHWSIDGTIALISAWLTYRFYKSEFYNNNQSLVFIICYILAIIATIYQISSLC